MASNHEIIVAIYWLINHNKTLQCEQSNLFNSFTKNFISHNQTNFQKVLFDTFTIQSSLDYTTICVYIFSIHKSSHELTDIEIPSFIETCQRHSLY